jgi:polysaccharide deacetylase family protein (PEP-CTERM system associated)
MVKPPRNAMTVDVEEYFQVSALETHISRTDWERIPGRIESSMERIFALFESRGVKATFFTLGWIAQRYPQLVRAMVDGGHEVASHGWEHRRACEQTPAQFRADITRTKELLEEVSGMAVQGYRAASFSIGDKNTWAWDELAAAGYRYSSSVVPIHHDHYGMPDAPRFAFSVAGNSLLEIPVSTLPLAGRNINCGGGGWFRLYPYAFSRWALQRINEREGRPGLFYFHPWEIDPQQPRQEGLSRKTRFRHYLNLERTQKRLEQLLDDFSWGRMDEVYLGAENAA